MRGSAALKQRNATGPLHARHNPWHGKSAYDRIAHDAYLTIDARCVARLLQVVPASDFNARGLTRDLAAGAGHIMRDLRAGGVYVGTGADLVLYPPIEPGLRIGRADFLRTDRLPRRTGNLVFNPPNHLSVMFVAHALALLRAVRGMLAVLVPSNWDLTPGRMLSFAAPLRFCIALGFRPIWFPDGPLSRRPREEWTWLVWDWRHKGPPVPVYA